MYFTPTSKIEQVVASSIQQGAKLLTGGKSLERAGYYYPPTILDCTDAPQADCITTELFGPVLSVDNFKDEAEAVQKPIARLTDWQQAFYYQFKPCSPHDKSDWIGNCLAKYLPCCFSTCTFGGHGLSGHGREGGANAVLDYTTTKTVWLRTSDEPIDDPFVMR